jgi:hypothetical protein
MYSLGSFVTCLKTLLALTEAKPSNPFPTSLFVKSRLMY